MASTSVSDLKNNLSAWLRKVRAGQSVVILDRDVPIARIERIETAKGKSDRLARLQAHGQVRPPVRRLTGAQLRTVAGRTKDDHARLLAALLADREQDR